MRYQNLPSSKDLRRIRILPMVALLAAVSVGSPAEAQTCLGGPESFRLELGRFITDLYALSDVLEETASPVSPEFRQAVIAYDVTVDEMPEAQLVRLCDFFSRYPEVAEAPRIVRSIAAKARNGSFSAKAACLALSREDYLAVYISQEILKASQLAAETLCNQAACPPVVPPVCAPAPECTLCSVVGVLSLSLLVFDNVLIQDNRCGLVTHYEAVEEFAEITDSVLEDVSSDLEDEAIPRLDAPLSSRASQVSLSDLLTENERVEWLDSELGLAIVELATLSTEQRDFRETDRRLYIEESLQAGQTGQISALRLPETFGGELEMVREVVADAILMNLAAGEDVNLALISFNKGDVALNADNYQQAFLDYRQAYQEAADLPAAVK